MTLMIFSNDLHFDDAELEVLYSEFANEDRELAESGLGDYLANLEGENVLIAHV